MKVTFVRGKRYTVKVRLPALISPKMALSMLKDSLTNVVIGNASRGVLLAEATWKAPTQTLDSVYILYASELSTKSSTRSSDQV